MKRAALHKYGRPQARPIVHGKLTNVENHSVQQIPAFLPPLANTAVSSSSIP
jgi:hypothetical protein